MVDRKSNNMPKPFILGAQQECMSQCPFNIFKKRENAYLTGNNMVFYHFHPALPGVIVILTEIFSQAV